MQTPILVITILVSLLVVSGIAVLHHPAFGRRVSAERKARIESSPNWRDGRFQNQIPTKQFTGDSNSRPSLWRFFFRRDTSRVPQHPMAAVKTDLHTLPKDRDWFVWFGHSSYLFCLNGKTFLVDPLLKMEFPPSLMLKPFKGTDIYSPEDMPEIDYLIITHEHWDHLDYATLRDLRPKVRHAVCPLGVAEYLEYWHYNPSLIFEMDWYDQSQMTNDLLQITCLPTRHFSNRFLGKPNQTLWASFMVESGGRKVYIGGDGGYDERFKQIHNQFGTVDLAVMENGQYNTNWAFVHMLPEDLEQAILDLQPLQVFTVHHDKFALSMHSWSEPDSVAQAIARKNNLLLMDQPIGTVIYF